jgi:hypothetical protein
VWACDPAEPGNYYDRLYGLTRDELHYMPSASIRKKSWFSWISGIMYRDGKYERPLAKGLAEAGRSQGSTGCFGQLLADVDLSIPGREAEAFWRGR